MDKTKLGVVGVIGSLAVLPLGANAAVPQQPAVPPAQSFAELLQPISNPVQKLQVSDAQEDQAQLIPAQYYRGYDRHHHHHHHHNRRWYTSRGYYWYNGGWVLRPRHHHHHHHHHN